MNVALTWQEFLSKQLQDLGLTQGDDSIIKKVDIDDVKGFGWLTVSTIVGVKISGRFLIWFGNTFKIFLGILGTSRVMN